MAKKTIPKPWRVADVTSVAIEIAQPTDTRMRVVHLMRQLYKIEGELRRKKPGPALRESVRAWQSAPLVRRIGGMLRVMLPKHRPASRPPAGPQAAAETTRPDHGKGRIYPAYN